MVAIQHSSSSSSLHSLKMNGNPFGKRAMRALFRAIRLAAASGRKVIIEFIDVDLGGVDDKDEVLDIHDPAGDYTLDMR